VIPESFVQDLLARVDIVDVVGRYVQLRKGGANLLGLCPFHNEKSPSFTVSPTKQFYHCFGCGAHGSAIKFLMEHTAASFPEAVHMLAASVGMRVPEETRSPRQQAESRRQREEASRHTQVLEAALAHYQTQLKTTPEALRYLQSRGLDGETAARFGLGWAGRDRQGLARVFADYNELALVESGLVIEAEDGRRYDRFRERVMFPIRNPRGALIGFGGRVVGRGEPKYLNSPETPLFSKGNELYGLWENRQGIRAASQVIVVEGYMDVVGLAQLGIAHAVATLGTATTPVHVQKLLRASDRIVFSFDGDAAGRRAAWRALQAALPLLRDDVALRFLFLPDGHDPDSYVRAFGAAAFAACIDEAVALSRFLLDELASRHRLDEAEGRAACVYEARPLIAAIPEGALRLQMERALAQQVRMTPEELAALFAQAAAQIPPAPLASSPASERAEDFSPGIIETRRSRPIQREPRNEVRHPGLRRPVVSLARRLIRLVLTHPTLVENMGDQQLEMLDAAEDLHLLRDLIVLAKASGAAHLAGLIAAAEAQGEDNAALLELLHAQAADVMAEEELPDPQTEWEDALQRIEILVWKAEQNALIESGLSGPDARQRFQELGARLAVLQTGKIR